jgi:uncharacterized membrane protein YhaH (DUF805 family)
MNNPYRAPTADLSQVGAAGDSYQPRLFSTAGRIGRVRYLAYVLGVWVLVTLVAAPVILLLMVLLHSKSQQTAFLPAILSAVAMGLSFIVAKRRINDMNKSGWFALLLLIPFVNLAAGFWLLFCPGDKGANDFGPAPCGNSIGVTLACLGSIVVLALVFLLASSMAAKVANERLSENVPVPAPQ